MELIARGELGNMVALRGTHIEAVDLATTVGRNKLVDPEGELVRMARAIGLCFGD